MTADLADLADLQLVWPGSISFFCYLGDFEFYNFLCIFSADSLWAAQHRESEGTGRDEPCPTGLRSRQQKGRDRGSTRWKQIEKVSGDLLFSAMSNSQLAQVLLLIPIYLEGIFALACPVSWPHRGHFLFRIQCSSVVFSCFCPHPLRSLFFFLPATV